MKKYIISVLVQNHSGVLARVSSLFGRRGFNIESLTVSPTTDETRSRITIVVLGDSYILDQVLKQVAKLEECIHVQHIQQDDAFCLELVLVKLRGDAADFEAIREVCDVYHADIVESEGDTMIVHKSGTPAEVDMFLSVIANFHVLESSRTGVTAMRRTNA